MNSTKPEVKSGSRILGSSIKVSCKAGFNGGLPQMFLLEVRHIPSGELVSNRTVTSKPHFFVGGLPPESRFKLFIYSFNDKGKSEPVIMETMTGNAPVQDAQDVKYSYSAGEG